MKATNDLSAIRDAWLQNLQARNSYQLAKDAAQAELVAEAMARRNNVEMRIREPAGPGFDIQGLTFDRRLTPAELADDARPRVRVLKSPPAPKPESRPSLSFTPVFTRGRRTSSDIIIAELSDETAGLYQIVQLEAVRRTDSQDCLDSWCLDPFARPIPGRSGKAFVDTGLRDEAGSRVFAEIAGLDPNSVSGLLIGELRSFPDDMLPVDLPSNVDLVALQAEETAKAQKAWREKHMDASDRQREREREALQASIDEGVRRELEKQKAATA